MLNVVPSTSLPVVDGVDVPFVRGLTSVECIVGRFATIYITYSTDYGDAVQSMLRGHANGFKVLCWSRSIGEDRLELVHVGHL